MKGKSLASLYDLTKEEIEADSKDFRIVEASTPPWSGAPTLKGEDARHDI